MTEHIDRRRALGLLGTLGLGAVATACGGGSTKTSSASSSTTTASTASTPSTAATASSTASTATPVVSCVLTPEVTQGPYYLDLNKLRSDITEGKPGTSLAIKITVVDATSCTPIKDAAVDIWHCDASGVYSGYSQEGTAGQTYLRGTQVTNSDGVVDFQTIYPGWYRGRAVHIHMKVHVGGADVHTGQLFFDPALNSTVYQAAAYSAKGATPDTTNSADSIYQQAGATSAVLNLTPSNSGYAGAIVVGVKA